MDNSNIESPMSELNDLRLDFSLSLKMGLISVERLPLWLDALCAAAALEEVKFMIEERIISISDAEQRFKETMGELKS